MCQYSDIDRKEIDPVQYVVALDNFFSISSRWSSSENASNKIQESSHLSCVSYHTYPRNVRVFISTAFQILPSCQTDIDHVGYPIASQNSTNPLHSIIHSVRNLLPIHTFTTLSISSKTTGERERTTVRENDSKRDREKERERESTRQRDKRDSVYVVFLYIIPEVSRTGTESSAFQLPRILVLLKACVGPEIIPREVVQRVRGKRTILYV